MKPSGFSYADQSAFRRRSDRPETNAVIADGAAGLGRERNERDERKRPAHDVFGGLVDAGPHLARGVAEQALEDRAARTARDELNSRKRSLPLRPNSESGNAGADGRVDSRRYGIGRTGPAADRCARGRRSAGNQRGTTANESLLSRAYVGARELLSVHRTSSLATRLAALVSAVSRLCVPARTDRLALYKEPPHAAEVGLTSFIL